jgi:hypothetical protein
MGHFFMLLIRQHLRLENHDRLVPRIGTGSAKKILHITQVLLHINHDAARVRIRSQEIDDVTKTDIQCSPQ